MIIEPKKGSYVTKSEKLLSARYELGELALKLISIIYSNVKRGDELGKDYQLRIADIANLMGKTYGEIYNEMKMATKELLENPVYIENNDDNWLMFNWISDAEYKDGIISFTISKRLKPLIIDLQEKFLKYKLENILNLRGVYLIRFYEILKDWWGEKGGRKKGKVELVKSVAELRELLNIPLSYKYGNSSGIKKRILEKAKKEFIEHTDIIFDFEEIKAGRRVSHLKITIEPNPKKLQNQEKEYLKSFKHFVSFIRNNYKANMKYFVGWNGIYFGINKEGLVYSNKKDLDPQESEKVFKQAYKFAKNSAIYQNLLEDSLDFQDDLEADPTLLKLFKEELKSCLK